MRIYILLIALWATILSAQPLELTINGEKGILMNAKTGRVLFAKNEHDNVFPASTTKIATALFALHTHRNRLNDVFTAERESIASITPQAKKQSNYRCPAYWLETDGTHVGIKKGEELVLKDLLYLMLIASANDASNVIAQGIGGTIPKFMEGLNAYLKALGCKNTCFVNPHGLHHPSHVTTAYDLALMAQESLQDPIFCEIVSSARYTCPKTNLELERHVVQTNNLLKKGSFYYSKAIGVKTGFTQTSGKNLVAAARDGDRTLIAIALGYRGSRAELYQDVIKMFDTAFAESKMRRILLSQGEQKLVCPMAGVRKKLKTYLAEDLVYDFYPSEETHVKVSIAWQVPPLPIAKGESVGKLKVIDNEGNIISETQLQALEELRASFFYSILKRCKQGGKGIFFAIGMGLVSFFCWRLFRKLSRF